MGIITLSDVLRYLIGEPGIGEGVEEPLVAGSADPVPLEPPAL